jgi:hypothetical protein
LKEHSKLIAPTTAMASAVLSLACCLPLGFVAALGAAGASVWLQSVRPWLLGLSIVLLTVGFIQQSRARSCGVKRGLASNMMLWMATLLVLAMIFFPQTVAAFLADHLNWSTR